jgi:protein TonB
MLLNTHRPTGVLAVIPNNPTATLLRFSPAEKKTVRPASGDRSFRYYGIPPPARIPWLALVISAGLHAFAILGFNGRTVVKKAVVVEEAPAEMLMMPDLDDPEDVKPVELNDDEPITAPAVQVPMLADIPTIVPVNAFTQLVDLTPPVKAEALAGTVLAIPVNIQRGRPDTSKIQDLFNIADLDRAPEPIVRTPPVFPFELKAQVSEAEVRLGFIVTSKGDVIMPYVVSATHHGFERPALEAVVKWKFKPGMRGGRKVNTRVEQPINFTVTND